MVLLLPGWCGKRRRIFVLQALFFLLFLFTLTPLLQAQKEWQVVGNEQQIATGASAHTSIGVITDNNIPTPYVAFTEGGIARVKKLAGVGNWQPMQLSLGYTLIGTTNCLFRM